MGKPYASELNLLRGVYRWAVEESVDGLADAIERSSNLPMMATGSGGSFSAAHLACTLQQQYSGNVSKAITPLEMVSSISVSAEVAVLCVSARGRNRDILGVFKQIVQLEPRELTIICAQKNAPLGKLAQKYSFVNLIEFDLPSGKDGFLATNSLIAFSVLLCRAYARVFQIKEDFPKKLEDLLAQPDTFEELNHKLSKKTESLWEKQTITVLHGPLTHSAALDIESKFSEAALGNIQIADYRNYAHGRHHWLAKKGDTTGILALVADNDRVLAERTLGLIPSRITRVLLQIKGTDLQVRVSSLVHMLMLVGLAGESKGIDPGRPKVQRFGRQLYNMGAFGLRQSHRCGIAPGVILAIERKTKIPVEFLAKRGELDRWIDLYQGFLNRLIKARFRAIALDFDGTLCDVNDRYTGVRCEIIDQLVRILESGAFIGVATGRGRSVKEDLRKKLPRELWRRLLVGYYNGSDIGLLFDDDHPEHDERLCDDLREVGIAIKKNWLLSRLSKCTFKRHQITVEPIDHARHALLWDLINEVVRSARGMSVNVLKSSHSIDVLPHSASKVRIIGGLLNLVKEGDSTSILCIGDKGKWPGNDFELLQEPNSLSVDEVSTNGETCWNLSPPGHRGVQATLNYLRAFSKHGNAFRLSLN